MSLFVSKFKNHLELKDKLIYLINKTSADLFDNENNKVITDYEKDEDFEYKKVVVPYLLKEIENVLSLSSDLLTKPKQVWFQQYRKDHFHSWHTHDNVQFGLIYFLKMKNNNYKTQFKQLNGDKIDYNSNEGDVVIFPSYLPHRSPIIDIDREEKIIIGMNFNVLTKNINY